jgi:hypothetical protein
MADRSILRVVRAVFDRVAAKKAEREMAESLGKAGSEGGKKAGQGFLKDLRHEFNKKKADLQVALARGTISEKEFKKQTALAAQTFRDGILRLMDEAKAKGKEGEAEYIKLSRALKRVGDEGEQSIGQRLTGAFKRAALAAGALFGLRQIQRFLSGALRAGQEVAAVQRSLEVQLRNVGVAWADVRGEVEETTKALWETHKLTGGEVTQILTQLTAATGRYDVALKAAGFTADLAAATNTDFGTAAKMTARILRGDLTVLRRHGIEVGSIAELQELLRDRYEASLTPMQKVGKAWGDLREAIGLAMMEAGDGASVFEMLTTAIRATTDWVNRNGEAFRKFVDLGIRPVINGLLALGRAVIGVGKIFAGTFFGILSAGAHGLSLLASAAALAEQAKARFLGLFSAERAAAAERQAAAIRDNARSLREWAKAAQEVGQEMAREGLFPGQREPGTRPDRPLPELPRLEALPGDGGADARAEAIDREAEAAARLEAQREALIAQMSRDIEVQGRRAAAILEGEEAVEALNRELFVQDALLRAGVEKGDEYYETFVQLAQGQYDVARAAEDAAASIATAHLDAVEAIEEEYAALTTSLGGMFLAWATSGLAGLARFAKAKVLENVAWAAESIAKAILGDPRGVLAAKQHGIAAAKWGVVAGAASAASSDGAAGGAALGGPSSGPAQRAQPLGPEINIHFVGPGFRAVNPEVQKVVWGAVQEAREVYGPDAKINVMRNGR